MRELELFRGVVPFVAVMEERSFTRAAVRLAISAAAVSKSVRQLEADLGVRLLERTSRHLAPTREGAAFFERCQQATAALKGARDLMEPARSVPEGELVVSAPFVAAPLVAPGLALLRARHPKLTFRLAITDRLTRLAEESVDVAVRIGALEDSSLVARKLCATRIITVASPSYVARRGTPAKVADLDAHDCLVVQGPHGKPHVWRFGDAKHVVPATVVVDHGPSVVDAALAGLGVAQVFAFMVRSHLREGHLVELLPELAAVGPDVHAVCSPGRRPVARVRAAFAAFADACASVNRG